jgi:Zn-dependent protease/CBS domain-containing protein
VGAGLELGRIAGIRIAVHWSLLVVFVLIAWTLATGVFPETNPDLSDNARVVAGLVAATLFVLSILLHELGHALQARRDRMEIDGIMLWLFGGVATFRGGFPSAGAEFRVAVAGPLVSLALGIAFVALAVVGLPESADAVAAWLGYVNLSLLVFNLIPALPLDGGRILHSALWHFREDSLWATRVGAGLGRAFGYLLIGLGVAMFVFQGAFSGAWLAFLGWFLLAAAGSEARYATARQALAGIRVRDLMVPDPVSVPPDLTLGRFMDDVVWQRRYTTYPVVDGAGRAVGLLPFRCVAEVPRAEWDARRVQDCMLTLEQVPILDPDEEAIDALAELQESEVGRGLVLVGDRLAGLLSMTDVARAFEAAPRRRQPPSPARTGPGTA